MATADDLPAAVVDERILAAARLRTLPTVATASADGVTERALTAHADAQGAVNEELQLDGGGRPDGADLAKVQLAGEDGAGKTDVLQERHALGRVVVHLRAGDQRQGRQI